MVQHQVSLAASDTIESLFSVMREAMEYGVKLKRFHTNNRIFKLLPERPPVVPMALTYHLLLPLPRAPSNWALFWTAADNISLTLSPM